MVPRGLHEACSHVLAWVRSMASMLNLKRDQFSHERFSKCSADHIVELSTMVNVWSVALCVNLQQSRDKCQGWCEVHLNNSLVTGGFPMYGQESVVCEQAKRFVTQYEIDVFNSWIDLLIHFQKNFCQDIWFHAKCTCGLDNDDT